MRRNIAQRRRMVVGWGFSPRSALAFFFVFCAFTYGAIIGWQIIIESDNEYLETGAALLTVLLFTGVSICLIRRYRAYRQGINELRQAHPHSPGESEDIDLTHHLSTQLIEDLVRSYTYSSKEKGSMVHVKDVELGLSRTNTVSSDINSEHVRTSRRDDANCNTPMCLTNDLCTAGTPLEYPSFSTECSVCLTEFNEGDMLSELPCRHTYHRDCVIGWLLLQNACPMCKQSVFVLPSSTSTNSTNQPETDLLAFVPTLGESHAPNAPPSTLPQAASQDLQSASPASTPIVVAIGPEPETISVLDVEER